MNQTVSDNDRAFAENYFAFLQDIKTNKKNITGKSLFSKLSNQPTINDLMNQVTAYNGKINGMDYFDQWKNDLFFFNILIYGLGDKDLIIRKFIDTHLNDHSVYIYTASKGSTLKDLLDKHGIIYINCLDNIRDEEEIKTLQLLFRIKRIICIIDNPRIISLLSDWDYNFQCYQVDSDFCYPLESLLAHDEASNSIMDNSEILIKGAKFVLSSLTVNARNTFNILAEHQIFLGEGLGFHAWYKKAQEKFIVSNEIGFRIQLTEFIDHNMILLSEDENFSAPPQYRIPFSNDQIMQIMQECK